MDRELIMWVVGGVTALILALIKIIYDTHSKRIDEKADGEALKDLERRHDEMGRRIGQMHDDNRHAATAMEARFRQDYASLNTSIAHLTGRVDQVLIQNNRGSQ